MEYGANTSTPFPIRLLVLQKPRWGGGDIVPPSKNPDWGSKKEGQTDRQTHAPTHMCARADMTTKQCMRKARCTMCIQEVLWIDCMTSPDSCVFLNLWVANCVRQSQFSCPNYTAMIVINCSSPIKVFTLLKWKKRHRIRMSQNEFRESLQILAEVYDVAFQHNVVSHPDQ